MNNFEELLISYVEQSPHLYNKSLKDYKDEGMKQNTWTSIAIKLESEPEKVKKRWENLRNNFVRAYRTYNEKLPSSSAAVEKRITFLYFRAMLWLAPYIRKENLSKVKSKKSDLSTAVVAFKTLVDYKTNASTQKTITDPADDAFLQSIILDMGKIKPRYRIQFKCELMKPIYTLTQME
ncbi:hypothetical protein ABEB36_000230 [Hypothenemus hampei]|uniref:MADF domain-containing protein n=1 Tax=Hypothenemus hampei TaxID=57062 RepID=A0ABD1FDS1_HYPHA